MKRKIRQSMVRKLRLASGIILALSAASLPAEDVFVTAFKGTVAAGSDNTPCPPSCTTGTVSATGAGSPSTATPYPVIPPSGRRMRFGSADGCTWSVTPTDTTLIPASGSPYYNFTSLQHTPGLYKIYVTKGSTSQASNLVVKMTADGGTLFDASSNAAPAGVDGITLFAAGDSRAQNQWALAGYISNTVASPTITFSHVSGALDSTHRWYMDAVYFQYVGDRCAGAVSQPAVDGPLAAGQTFATVTGVIEGATNVSVYANSWGTQTLIGETNYAAGFAAGKVVVPTTPLSKSDQLTASQMKGGCVSTLGTAGPAVGGGPNSSLRVFLSCWQNEANAGPIGANSSAPASGNPYILKATKVTFGNAPEGGQPLPADACWRTVTFQNGVDDACDMNDGHHVTNNNAFCSLEALVFALETADSGPYDVYVDRIMNGDIVVEDFESYAAGTTNTFATPRNATQPNPSISYLSSPNSSLISDKYAFDGAKSCRIQWQWADEGNTRWARVVANAATGKRYPQLDTRKPITVHYLLLPVGQTSSHKFSGAPGAITNAINLYLSATNTIGIAVAGPGPYTYEWSLAGGYLYNPNTESTYTIGGGNYGRGADGSDAGVYRVAISDGFCTEERSVLIQVLDPIPTITNQPAHVIATAGSPFSLKVGADGHVPAGYPLNYQWFKNGEEMAGGTQEIYPVGNASLADVAAYQVVVGNGYGSVTSGVATVAVVPPGVAAGAGTGLRADYWAAHYSTNAFGGAPTLTRMDPRIDFDWGADSPGTGIAADYFTARWLGQVQALGTDSYTFSTISDDGVRLWVNGQLLVNNWTPHAATTNSGVIALTGVGKYDLQMEYFENAGGAVAKLYWTTASGSVGWEPVPQSQLYPAAALPTPGLTFSVNQGTNLVFNWGPGSYTLTWATNVAGPYTNKLTGVTSPCAIIMGSDPARFYRLQVQ